jgi:cell division protein FtsQ
MARKSSGTILQEELYPSSAEHSRTESARFETPRAGSARVESGREELDDARLVDLDVDEESPFLRGQKRVSARRSSLPKKTASRLLWASAAAAVLCVAAIAAAAIYEYGERSWRFRVESSDNIDISGVQNATKAQIMEVMGADIGRNIFFVPLSQQKAQLEQIPWVESASVMRFVPNRLQVEIQERTPVAFARVGPRISLIDAGGTLMELPPKHKYSFPVILGMNPGEPLSTRAPRMKAYNELVQDLDSGGARYSQELSEVDLSDLENLKVRVNDAGGDVLVELGSSDYLKRYQTYVSHVQQWRQQFQKLESVNLRYDNQVIVNPDLAKPSAVKTSLVRSSMARPSMAKPEMVKAAMKGRPLQTASSALGAKAPPSGGVKPAALITPMNPHDRTLPKPAFELTEKKLDPKSAAEKKTVATKPGASKFRKPKARRGSSSKKVAAKAATTEPKGGASAALKLAATKPAAPTASAPSATPKPSAAIAKPPANTSSN